MDNAVYVNMYIGTYDVSMTLLPAFEIGYLNGNFSLLYFIFLSFISCLNALFFNSQCMYMYVYRATSILK